jgi:VWFA-related protein
VFRPFVLRVAAVATCAALGAAALAAQQPAQTPIADAPPVTFRAEVNFVEVDVFVTDASGAPVTDLAIGDFEVLEDGVPQTIDTFTHVNIPIERFEQPLFAEEVIEPDVARNIDVEGRVYLFVIDDYHIDFRRQLLSKTLLEEFITTRMGANDVGAVVYLSGRGEDGQDFTNSRQALLAAVDNLQGRKLDSPTVSTTREFNRPAVQALLERGDTAFIRDPLDFERLSRARQALDGIRELAGFMESVRGRRKTMVLVSEGTAFNTFDPFSTAGSIVLDESQEAIAAATRANVTIYALDPRGLGSTAEDLVLAANSPQADTPRISDESPDVDVGLNSLNNELRLSRESLLNLSERTGGFATVNRNTFDEVFDRIVRENSAYYVIGYYSANERRNADYRRLEVRVTRPGVDVRSRDGYVAPRGNAPEAEAVVESAREAAVREALLSPLAVTGIPLSVYAGAWRGAAPDALVPVVLEFDGSRLPFVEGPAGTFDTVVTVTLIVTDGDGDEVASVQHAINLALRPETLEAARARGVRVVSELALPPGRHRVRAVVSDEAGRAGSAAYDLDVPDFGDVRLALSGVALSAASAGQVVTARAFDPLGQWLPGPPIATREFARGDRLTLFAELYENRPDAPVHGVDLTTTLRAPDGRVVFRSEEARSSSELTGGRGGYGYAAEVPLDVEPGLYVLRVEGRSRLSGAEAGEVRDIVVRVRP